MDAHEAIKHIRTLASVGVESDKPEILRRHIQMILDVIEKVDRAKVVPIRPKSPK